LLNLVLKPPSAGLWTPPAPEELESLFAGYRVERLLGRGGMGAVYLARQVALERLVAIKVLPAELAEHPEAAERFHREAVALARLSHPHIVPIFDSGQTATGLAYFVMEYVEGTGLDELIHPVAHVVPNVKENTACTEGAANIPFGGRPHEPRSALTPDRALAIVEQVCDALTFAHAQGIVHRDLKPANVLIGRDGRARVADFGVARLIEGETQPGHTTLSGALIGTPDYMAPEQKRGQTVDHRADIYALGVVLYEALCGETPQGAFEPPSRRCRLPRALDAVITRAIASRPEERFQTTLEMKAAVSAVRPAVARAQTASIASPASRRTRAWFALGAIAAIALAVAIGGPIVLGKGTPLKRNSAAPTLARAPSVSALTAAEQPRADGWEPLAEWKVTVPGKREFQDGWLHVQNNGVAAPQSSPDGAVRARLRFRQGIGGAALSLRNLDKQTGYGLVLTPTGKEIGLFAENSRYLSSYVLPRPLQPGDTIRLELRAVGDHIVGLADDVVAIDVHDSQVTRTGRWGIGAANGWFQDAEVQSLPATASTGARISSSPVVTAPASPGAASSTTPGDVLFFSGHRYELVMEALTWDEAKAKAETMGGHLATLTSKEENEWILKNVKRTWSDNAHFWIGGSQNPKNKNGKWTWVTGEPMDMNLWGGQGPDGSGGALAVYYPYGPPCWDDVKDSAIYFFLVEWDGEGAAKPATAVSPPPAATTNSAAPLEAPLVNSLGMKFLPVPIIGGPTNGQRVLFSIWETRVQDYEAFAKETQRGWRHFQVDFEQGPAHPALEVSWEDATAFCAWLTDRERKAGKLAAGEAYRLPHDHEWSCAIGIGDREDPATPPRGKSGKLELGFPWGAAWPAPNDAGNYRSDELRALQKEGIASQVESVFNGRLDGFGGTAPVGSYAPNRFGLYDMGGNAWEWCEEWFDKGETQRVLRGGCWTDMSTNYLQSSSRSSNPPKVRNCYFGFRVVLASAAQN
jgi:formylglycine-generating enzyme required for sulfatase activity